MWLYCIIYIIYIYVYYVFFWYFVCTHFRYVPYSICIWVSCCEGDIRATCHGNTTAGFNWPAISQRYRKYIVCIVFDIYMIYVWSQLFAYDLKILVDIYYTYKYHISIQHMMVCCKFHHIPGCSRTLQLSLWSLRPVVDLDPRSGKATTAKGKTSKGRKKTWVVKGRGWNPTQCYMGGITKHDIRITN